MTQQWSLPAWAVLVAGSVALVALVVLLAGAVLLARVVRRAAAARAEADARLARLEARVEELAGALERPAARPSAEEAAAREFVITRLGEEERHASAPTVPAPLFADLVLRETVVQAASLAHGLRCALSAENRHRIRFEMRRELKRARKSRRAETKQARRDRSTRERAEMVG